MSGCQLCLREPAYEVIAHQIPPHNYRLCEGCCRLWAARGIAVTTVSAIAESDASLPPAGGARPAIAATAAAALNGDGDIEHRVAG